MSGTTVASFVKREIGMRYWLQGAKYFNALRAMEFAKQYHTGYRKDGVTPEFDHQISIAHYVRTIHAGLEFPEDTIATVFLHDVREDYGVAYEEVEKQFGTSVANAVDAMTKVFRGEKKFGGNMAMVFENIAQDPIASVAKGADRIHNFDSMVGVFKLEKQKDYIEEGESYFLPMLKSARRHFVLQEPIYQNIKTMLESQIKLIKAIHHATEKSDC